MTRSVSSSNMLPAVVLCVVTIALAACGGGGAPAVYPRFAYVANQGDNTVSIYAVDATTGRLRANGYVAAGATPVFVTVDPSGKFAYVATHGSDTVSAYAINATTGALTSVGAPVAAGGAPISVTTTGTIR